MKWVRVTAIVLLAAAGLWVAYRGASGQTGHGYYTVKADGKKVSVSPAKLQRYLKRIEEDAALSDAEKEAARSEYVFSWPRTIGIWFAAFFTLALLSFLYKDNPIYKIAEHAFVGISAAYWMTVAFWNAVVPNMLGKLFPSWVKFSMLPGLDLDDVVENLATKSWFAALMDYETANGDGLTAQWWQLMDLLYWIPVVLGVMLLWRLAPKGAWIARWPLAYIIGTTAGLRLIGFLEADFVAQIRATILPLVEPAYDGATGQFKLGSTFYQSMSNILIVAGVACGLIYFFFSTEHKGLIGRASRIGIFVLMITFGAGFGYTVMGRIALLVGRFEFLLINWLSVVPP
jgi:hypothetical protein